MQGSDSPGAVYDHAEFLKATRAVAPAFTIASSRVDRDDAGDTPGAAAYLLKNDAAFYKFPTPATAIMASAIRTDWAAILGGSASPGPGAHDSLRGIGRPDIRAQSLMRMKTKWMRALAHVAFLHSV
jgi:hypothetical protein